MKSTGILPVSLVAVIALPGIFKDIPPTLWQKIAMRTENTRVR